MASKELQQKFLEITAEYCDVAANDITPEMHYIEDLGFSSFDFMAYLGDLEEEFDVEVDEDEVKDLRTIEGAMKYIDALCE